MANTAQHASPDNPALQHIKAGNTALRQGKRGLALSHFIAAVKKAPQNHHYKVHLCEFLKNVSFPHYEPDIEKVILSLLQTDGLDYQCLWQAWLSLVQNNPEMAAFKNLMVGEKYEVSTLEENLKNPFFIAGIEKLFCADIAFENSLREIKNLIDDKQINAPQFSNALKIYDHRTEGLFSDNKNFTLDYKIDETIPSLSTVQNTTSKKVRDQYEHSPYPRWTSYHKLPPPLKNDKPPYNHLIAGCGTGFSSCMTAMIFPHARVTAIDLSRASLTYAKNKVEELELDNIDFFHADILELNNLDKQFDVIECSGVLHHMKDPIEGWRCLIKKLKPDGKMHIGLYSELGRADVVAARQFIADKKFKSTPPDIRKARLALTQLPDDHPAYAVTKRRDFYNLSGCRDLIFHVQEHRFTVPQIQDAIDTLNLVFDGFNIDSHAMRQQYLHHFPDDKRLQNLENWHIFEKENPNFFKGMYQFWCHKGA